MKKILPYIRSPIFSVSIGIIGLLLSLFFYYSSQNKIEPKYQVSGEHYLIRVSSQLVMNANDLKILWKGDEIEEAYYSKIAFWNNGLDYIGKERLSESDPLRISYSENIEVIGASLLGQSRDELEILLKVDRKDKNIYINYEENEALEKNDGGVVFIIYTGLGNPELKLEGRVKGSSSGFEKTINLNNSYKRNNIYFEYFLILIFSFFIYVGYLYQASMINFDQIKKSPLMLGKALLFYGFALLIIIMFISQIYLLFIVPDIPIWMNKYY